MWGLDSLGLPITSADGNITLPLWAAGVAAVLLLVFFILALIRTGLAGTLVFIALVGFGIWGALAWADHERLDQRRALEQRLAMLEAQALAPASALACLDASGDAMETSCERTIFASPETASAAMSFTAARLLLLQDGLRFAASRDSSFESAVESLRKALESDRYGVVAQVFTARNGCSPERCDALRVLRDPTRVRANMRDRIFETNVARYNAAWPARAATSVTTPPNGVGTIPGTVAAPVPPRYTLPSAASIPPVSIMNNEPAANTPPAGAQSPATAAAPPATAATPPAPASRRPAPPRSQATTPASPPMPLSPAAPPRP